jgi:hypothetical protein
MSDNDLTVALPQDYSADDAFALLAAWLSDRYKRSDAAGGERAPLRINLRAFFSQTITDAHRPAIDEHLKLPSSGVIHDLSVRTEPFVEVAWELVRRGIFTPSTTYSDRGLPRYVGDEFTLTAYGMEWLRNYPDYNVTPTEYSRFAARLREHEPRFGNVFAIRSREALACYRAALYLACCVMCGAAAEAIALSVASAKTGNPDRVRAEYSSRNGTTRLFNIITGQASQDLRTEIQTYLGLLKHWRDPAAHADPQQYDEELGFLSMLLLFRFAHLVDNRWTVLTAKTNQP